MRLKVALLLLMSVFSVNAENNQYALATAHPLATQAGYEILQQGGNAFDAAVAVSAVLGVVEPYGSGFGGGGFWLLHQAKTKREIMIDGRETAPLASSADMYLDSAGHPIKDLSVNGALATAIPGMPSALVHLAEKYGSLPLMRLLAPAIKIAEQGFYADRNFIKYAKLRREVLRQSLYTRKTFLIKDDVPTSGDVIKQPDLANTIKRIAQYGRDGFYQGTIAQEMVSYVKKQGGIWSLKDLANYSIVERKPIRFRYRGAEIVSAPPPSSGGIVLHQMFNILSEFKLAQMSHIKHTHYTVEAMRRAYRDRSLWLGDTDFVEIPSYLTSQKYASQLAKSIDPNRATVSQPATDTKEGSNTSHFSIIDAQGNRVAATLSINYPFGSGLIAGSTGVLLNNEMDDFVAAPGVANLYGLTGGKANAITPGKRMLSSMSPTFIDDGERVAVLGTPGGSRIITMVALGIMEFLNGSSAQAIVNASRYHHQYLPDEIMFEPQMFSEETQRQLKMLGHTLATKQSTYGNMQIVIFDSASKMLTSASDPRGVGSAKVGSIAKK